ncbi:orotidine-5'-phosphate decarboxylase [Celerinatantimonas sp. MCCC 1A17872]|uniref:orotidine-5'-phosphate decarboxylase n=1 Tax=Celerinatantimonas sp. MCCC 1A17872 TaxID=3177514 RepID=UPI0038BF651E
MQDPKVIIALDFDNKERCLELVHQLEPKSCRLKIGKEMFTRFGPELVKELQSLGFEIFLDLKFHDIPNTVAKAVQSAADLGVWMVNVHASGGRRMMMAAKEALKGYTNAPKLIAVTVLTSMEQSDLEEVGYSSDVAEQVKRLALLTSDCGLDGVVCSAQEAHLLRQYCPDEFLLVTPGIRLTDKTDDDQRRIMTPEKAIAAGSSYLVIGRPITQSDNPLQVVNSINASLN